MSQPMRSRLVALVGVVSGERRATHTSGYPLDPAKMLPLADVVLLVAEGEPPARAGQGPGPPSAMLFRYTAHGEFGGDTWHPSVAEAREQAAEEYRDALGAWIEVPEGVDDPHVFAVKYAADRLNSRGDW